MRISPITTRRRSSGWSKLDPGGKNHGGAARDDPDKARACLGVLGNRPLRRGAFGEGRARLPALRRDSRPGRPEALLFLRGLPGRGGAAGAPADPPLQALLREKPALARRPARAPLRQEPDTFGRRLALTFSSNPYPSSLGRA